MAGLPTAAEIRASRRRLAANPNITDAEIQLALQASVDFFEWACRRPFDRVTPPGIRIALGIMVEDLVTNQTSKVPDRATSVTTPDGSSYSIARGDAAKGRFTGLESIDQVLRQYRIEPSQIG